MVDRRLLGNISCLALYISPLPHPHPQVAIEQLQAELTASRKEELAIRDEAQRVSRLDCNAC